MPSAFGRHSPGRPKNKLVLDGLCTRRACDGGAASFSRLISWSPLLAEVVCRRSFLIQFGAPVLAAFAGGAVGWWLRGRPTGKAAEAARSSRESRRRRRFCRSLQAAAETVRSCVEQHTDCIRTIQVGIERIDVRPSPHYHANWPSRSSSRTASSAPVQRHPQYAQQASGRRFATAWRIRTVCCSRSPRSIDRSKRTARCCVAGSACGRVGRRDQRARPAAAENQRRAWKTARIKRPGQVTAAVDADSRCHGRHAKASRRGRAADRGTGRKRADAGDSDAHRSADVAAESPGIWRRSWQRAAAQGEPHAAGHGDLRRPRRVLASSTANTATRAAT